MSCCDVKLPSAACGLIACAPCRCSCISDSARLIHSGSVRCRCCTGPDAGAPSSGRSLHARRRDARKRKAATRAWGRESKTCVLSQRSTCSTTDLLMTQRVRDRLADIVDDTTHVHSALPPVKRHSFASAKHPNIQTSRDVTSLSQNIIVSAPRFMHEALMGGSCVCHSFMCDSFMCDSFMCDSLIYVP